MVLKSLALFAAVAAAGVAAGDYPPPPPKGDGPPPPPKGDGPPPPPTKSDGPPPPKPTDEVTSWGGWDPKCHPIKYEPYVCDDDYGHEYTTTYTLYPHDCTLYYEKPTPTPKKTSTWATWEPKPTDDGKCHVVKYEPYVCDDEYGHETTKTYTLYPHDCTLYYEKPTETPKKTWNTWAPKTTEDPKKTWEAYPEYPYHPHPYPPKPTDPAKWPEWEIEKKIVIITIIEEYTVPCSTGWAKETTTIYTTHCGCEETPVPVHPPYKTYTTECPEAWGVGKTVTYTVPEPTYTPKPEDYTWLEWYKSTDKPVDPAKETSTWAEYTYVKSDEKTSTWAEYTSVKSDEKTSTWAEYTPVEPAKESSWSTWATSSAYVAKPSGYSPVAVWTGAASSSAISQIMVVAAGAVAGLALFL